MRLGVVQGPNGSPSSSRRREGVPEGDDPQPAGPNGGPGQRRKEVPKEGAPDDRQSAGPKRGRPRQLHNIINTVPTQPSAASPAVLPVAARRPIIPPLPIAGGAPPSGRKRGPRLPREVIALKTMNSGIEKLGRLRPRKVVGVATPSPVATAQHGGQGRPLETAVHPEDAGPARSIDGGGSRTLVPLEISRGVPGEVRGRSRHRKQSVPKRGV